jgi:hypothetical protein
MKILKSYGTGIKQASLQGKMVLVLWVFSLLFTSVVYFMGAGYFAGALGRSELAENLLQKFDAGLFLEMLVHNQAPLGMMFKVMAVLAFLYYWVSLFLTGGILHVLLSPGESVGNGLLRRRFAPVFFQGAGRYFGRFFRLEVCSLILWAAFIVFQLVFSLAAKPLTSDGTNEKMLYYVFWFRVGLSLVLIFFICMVLDYARIIIVRTETSRAMRSLWDAWRFVFKRLFGTLALYYVLLITGGIIFLVYWGIHSRIPTGSLFPIWLAFLVGQIFVISRGWLKIAFQSAQLTFYGRS